MAGAPPNARPFRRLAAGIPPRGPAGGFPQAGSSRRGAGPGGLIDCQGGAVAVYRPGAGSERHGDLARVAPDPELAPFALDLPASFSL